MPQIRSQNRQRTAKQSTDAATRSVTHLIQNLLRLMSETDGLNELGLPLLPDQIDTFRTLGIEVNAYRAASKEARKD